MASSTVNPTATTTTTNGTAKQPKPVFINELKQVIDEENIQLQITSLRAEAADSKAKCIEAIEVDDRPGVMLVMKVSGIYIRAANNLEKALLRAKRVRLSKEERAAFTKDGTLPAGYKQVNIEDDDDDDAADTE